MKNENKPNDNLKVGDIIKVKKDRTSTYKVVGIEQQDRIVYENELQYIKINTTTHYLKYDKDMASYHILSHPRIIITQVTKGNK